MAIDQAPNLRVDPDERGRAPRRKGGGMGLTLLAGAAVALAAWLWWPAEEGQLVSRGQPVSGPADLVPPAPGAPTTPKYPLEAAAEEEVLVPGDLKSQLDRLLGTTAVATFLELGDFPRRVVATVDNLGRDHAPPAVWPVQPTAGRFAVTPGADGQVIAPDNAQRYTPFVKLAASVDAGAAAALYRQMYPLLQQTYRELGFGDRYFNDRLVEVIDLLLATPVPAAPPRVQLTQVKGPIASERPWVRYEFVDPKLESLAAGQKMLVRMGPENAKQLKQKLRELRAQLVSGGAAAPR